MPPEVDQLRVSEHLSRSIGYYKFPRALEFPGEANIFQRLEAAFPRSGGCPRRALHAFGMIGNFDHGTSYTYLGSLYTCWGLYTASAYVYVASLEGGGYPRRALQPGRHSVWGLGSKVYLRILVYLVIHDSG